MVRLTVDDIQRDSGGQAPGELAPLTAGEDLQHALGFVQDQRLEQPLLTARRLVARWFGPDTRLILRHLVDPEDDQQYLELGAKVAGEPASILNAYDGYTREWIAKVPAPVREHIRFAYDFEA